MNTAFTKSFTKDLKKLAKEKNILERVREIILEVEAAASIAAVSNLQKLKAEGSHFRIRSGDYRVGLTIDGDTVTFVRVLHRSEIYRFFP